MIRGIRRCLLLALAGLSVWPRPALAASADAWVKRMPDGSVLTLVGIFVGEKREARYRRRGQTIEIREGLTIWTTRTGILRGPGRTIAALMDGGGRTYELSYEGPVFFSGPTPPSLKEEWGLTPAPPPGQPLRLHVSLPGTDAKPDAVDFDLPPVEELRARQFVGRQPDVLMAEAVNRADTDVIRMLLEQGAHANIRGEYGFTPLMAAATVGDFPLAKDLLDRGAALDVRYTSGGCTALFYAVFFRQAEVAELLLARGADPNLRAARITLLDWAIGRENVRAVRALVRRGAKLNIRSREGRSRIAYARKIKNWEMVEVLRSAGARDTTKRPSRRRR